LLMLIMVALLAGLFIRTAIPPIDWTAPLRLAAPSTADHPIEELPKGDQR